MVIFHIKHYINEKGELFFRQWFAALTKLLDNHNGFISTKYSLDKTNEGGINLFLEFENKKSLKIWRNSEDHKKIKSLLIPYQKKRHESHIYKINKAFYSSKIKRTQ